MDAQNKCGFRFINQRSGRRAGAGHDPRLLAATLYGSHSNLVRAER